MTHATAQHLIDAFDEEHALYQALEALALQMRGAVLADDVARVSALTETLDTLASAMREHESQRELTAGQLAAETGAAGAHLSALVARLDDESAVALTAAGERLRLTALAVQAANRSNTALLHRAVSLSQRRAMVLQGAPPTAYQADGEPRSNAPNVRNWVA